MSNDKEAGKPAAPDALLQDLNFYIESCEQGFVRVPRRVLMSARDALTASPAAPSVEQDERVRQFEALCDLLPSDVSWGDHLTPDIARHIARAASTSANKRDERGAFSAIHEFLGIASKRLYPTPDKTNSDWSKLRAAVDALALLEARAASTSANVAQCTNCGMAVDPKCGCSLGRAASANVAQGSEAIKSAYRKGFMAGWNGEGEAISPPQSAPPAQTALADDARDAARYRWLRKEHFPTADNPPLAQVVWKAFDIRHSSDWANMIDGDDLDRAIDAALTAAQSASGDTKP